VNAGVWPRKRRSGQRARTSVPVLASTEDEIGATMARISRTTASNPALKRDREARRDDTTPLA